MLSRLSSFFRKDEVPKPSFEVIANSPTTAPSEDTLVAPRSRRQTLRRWAAETQTGFILPEHILAVIEKPRKRKSTEGKWNLVYCYNEIFSDRLWNLGSEVSVIGTPKIGRSIAIPNEGEITVNRIIQASQGIFSTILFSHRPALKLPNPPWPEPRTEILETEHTVNLHDLAQEMIEKTQERYPNWGLSWDYKTFKFGASTINFNEELCEAKTIRVHKLPEVATTRLPIFPIIVSCGINALIYTIDPARKAILQVEHLNSSHGKGQLAPFYHDAYCYGIRGIPIWCDTNEPRTPSPT